MGAVARLGIATGTMLVVAGVILTPAGVTSSLPDAERPAIARAAATDAPLARRPSHDEGAGAVDLYGNEVNDAIATYSLDPAGSLYELHSPQTEVPRLGSPKS